MLKPNHVIMQLRASQVASMSEEQLLYDQAKMLAQRLERVSVDSLWARRSSGHRGALLRWIERFEQAQGEPGLGQAEKDQLSSLIEVGFRLLERAVQEQLR